MSGVKWWPDGTPSATIDNGIVVAGWIHNALTVGDMNAWLYWWYNGGSDTNEGLLLNGQDTKRHYTFGNFTRFVRLGYTRVDITGNIPANVLLTAYKGNSKVVIVAINTNTAMATVPITISGGTAPTSLTPWVTSASANLASQTAVAVTGGSFTATLAATSVTTFVGANPTAVLNNTVRKNTVHTVMLSYKAGCLFFSSPLPDGTTLALFNLNGRMIFKTVALGASIRLPLQTDRVALWRVEHPKLIASGRVLLR
jgi:hypothetical protein